jgi:hypothetical protein
MKIRRLEEVVEAYMEKAERVEADAALGRAFREAHDDLAGSGVLCIGRDGSAWVTTHAGSHPNEATRALDAALRAAQPDVSP